MFQCKYQQGSLWYPPIPKMSDSCPSLAVGAVWEAFCFLVPLPPVCVLWKEVLVLLPGSRERLDSSFLQLQPDAGVKRTAPIPARRKLPSGPGNPTRSSHVTLRNEAIYVKTSGHPAALVPSPHPSQLFFWCLSS